MYKNRDNYITFKCRFIKEEFEELSAEQIKTMHNVYIEGPMHIRKNQIIYMYPDPENDKVSYLNIGGICIDVYLSRKETDEVLKILDNYK
jgi:hypothetical protein